MMHAHTWTARAQLRELDSRQTVMHHIRRELLALKDRIDQIEDLEDAAVCKDALKQLWNTFTVIADMEVE